MQATEDRLRNRSDSMGIWRLIEWRHRVLPHVPLDGHWLEFSILVGSVRAYMRNFWIPFVIIDKYYKYNHYLWPRIPKWGFLRRELKCRFTIHCNEQDFPHILMQKMISISFQLKLTASSTSICMTAFKTTWQRFGLSNVVIYVQTYWSKKTFSSIHQKWGLSWFCLIYDKHLLNYSDFKHCDHKCRLLGQLKCSKYVCIMHSFSRVLRDKQWTGNQHL